MFNAFLKLYGYADGMNEHICLVFVFLSVYLYAYVCLCICVLYFELQCPQQPIRVQSSPM